MTSLESLQKEIDEINSRNKAVEENKAWEISYTRRISLTLLTYAAVGLYMYIAQIPYPWLNAIVPTIAFMLSTATLPLFKKLWTKIIK